MRIVITAALVFATGCLIPEKELTPLGDPFGCFNQPLPIVAKDPVLISGTLTDPYTGMKLKNTVVEGYQVGLAARVFMTTSDDGGAFRQTQGTGTAPRNAFLHVAPSGFLDTYYYPAVPIADDFVADIQMFTAMEIATLAAAAQVTIDPTKAIFTVTVTDCNGMPLGGATVSTTPAGTVRYFDAGATPSPTAVATDSRTGTALVANVPASNTTIQATVDGRVLRSHAIDAVAGALIETEIQP